MCISLRIPWVLRLQDAVGLDFDQVLDEVLEPARRRDLQQPRRRLRDALHLEFAIQQVEGLVVGLVNVAWKIMRHGHFQEGEATVRVIDPCLDLVVGKKGDSGGPTLAYPEQDHTTVFRHGLLLHSCVIRGFALQNLWWYFSADSQKSLSETIPSEKRPMKCKATSHIII